MTVRRPIKSLSHPDMPDASILTRIEDRYRERLGATRAIVYGSVARGEATIHSDIDLLVIAPSEDRTFRRLVESREGIDDLSFRLPISPIIFTPEEFALRQRQGETFLRVILEEGSDL